jgi:MFS superfamily sulfate permease-like transporter
MSLTSASGGPIGSQTRTEINVQAGWETPVVIVIAVLVVAMFAFGIVRTILRRRKPGNG